MKKKILIFSPFNFATNFLGLNFEFLQNGINDGNEVFYVSCHKAFKSCGFNPYGLKYMCEICVERFETNKKNITGHFNFVALNDILDDSDFQYSQEKLAQDGALERDYVVDDFEVGEATHSSFISKTRKRNFELPEELKILRSASEQSLMIYNATRRFIRAKGIDKIVIFNGRWDHYRAALSAARAEKIEINVIENLREGGYYESFGDALPHNIKVRNRLIDDHWNSEPNYEVKRRMALEYFEKKRSGLPVIIDKSYTGMQIPGRLPNYLDPDKRLVVLYNSSDDEYAAVGKEYINPFFKDQTEGILHIVKLVSSLPDFQLVIRMHPNLTGLKRDYLDAIYSIQDKYPNVFVILPDEDVDSYTLMEKSEKTISFGSTTGLESAYWGKPVITLGKSFYFYADVAYVPKSVDEIMSLLKNPLEPKPRINSEKYGYYFLTGGSKAKYYKSDSKNHSYFKEKRIDKLSSFFKFYYRVLKGLKIKN